MNAKKLALVFALLLTATVARAAAPNDLTAALQRGLFEEEANRNLDAAMAAYQSLVGQFDKDRQIAATAVFRLGEVYRKQGKTNEAVLQYERIVKEFADQSTLATLSRQNLAGLGNTQPLVNRTPQQWYAEQQAQLRKIAALQPEYVALRTLVTKLKELPPDSQAAALPSMLSAPDATLDALLKSRNDLERRVVELAPDFGPDHPTMTGLKNQLETVKSQLDQRVAGITLGLEARTAALRSELESAQIPLSASSISGMALSPSARAEQRRLLKEEIKLVEQKLGDQQTMVQSGVISPSELVPTQRDVLELKRKLVALSDENPAAGGSTSSLDGLQSQYALLKAQLEQSKRETNNETVAKLFDDESLRNAVEKLSVAQRAIEQTPSNMPSAMQAAQAEPRLKAVVEDVRKRLFDYQELRLRILESAIQQAKAATDPKLVSLDIPSTNDEDQEIRRIQAMIQNSPDLINAPAGEGGQTPLITAASKGQITVARYLLDHGANVNARAGDSTTALQLATLGGHKAMVELLLSRGADVNARRPANSTGTTALHIASDRGFKSVVEVLLANKAEVNSLAKQSSGSRYYAGAGTPLLLTAKSGHLDIVRLLLQSKANPNLADTDGTTALHEAARQGHRATGEALLDAGADVNAANPRQGTPLLLAAEGGHLEMVDSLLAHGAKVDARRDGNSYWPLLTAVGNGHLAVVRTLLEHKADPNLVGPDSPVGLAVQKSSTEILELLLQHDANPNLAPMVGNKSLPFPLLLAAANDKADAVALLLKFKADPNQRTASGGETALQYAITHPQIVKRLLEAGANPNARDGEGRTPLLRAVDQGDLESADLLLQHGADPNEAARQGFTPLHTAVANGNQPMVELLLKNKADPNRLDETGRTPLDLAKQSRNSSIPRGVTSPPLPMPGKLPGSLPGMSGSTPWPGIASGTVSQASTNDMVTLLRQGGALDDFPRMDRIEISRSSTGYREVVFSRGTNDWNQYRLLEVLAWRFGLIRISPQGIWEKQRTFGKAFWDRNPCRYPELRRVLIHRPQPDGKGRTTIPVDVAKLLSSGDCSLDQPLKWGDIVEFPEADHPVNESWGGPAKEELDALLKCVSRQISLSVKGSNSVLTLRPIYMLPGGGMPSENGRLDPTLEVTPASYVLRSVMDNSQLIRASSDLAQVKVTRPDPTGSREWVLDCSGSNAPQFWLRNGDVIEVPEKP